MFEPVARLSDIPSDIPHAAQLSDGTRLCLVRSHGQVFALLDRCPHRDFGLSGGDLVEPFILECPWHGARFDVRSGCMVKGPAEEGVETFTTLLKGDDVLVERNSAELHMTDNFKSALAPRDDFPLLVAHKGLHYLDSAATSQKPRAVLDAMNGFYESANANPHRGAYELSAVATDAYHDARRTVARFVGAEDSDCVIFTKGTTDSINLVATSLGYSGIGAGDEIVVTAIEHHANFVPWQQLAHRTGATLKIAELNDKQEIDLESLYELLCARTKVLAITHVSNAVGSITPLDQVIAMVRERSPALIAVDGAQAVPHLPVSFDTLDADFYSFSGHKMLGPMGIGVLVGKRALLERLSPSTFGGDMIEVVGDHSSTWNVLPHKFEAGTPNAAGSVGLAAAVTYLEGLGIANVRSHERTLLELAEARLSELPGSVIYGPTAANRSGVVSFTIPDVHPHDLATILDQHGVCIRAGHHCAQPLMRRLGVYATARASFYVYSDESDINALGDSLMEAQSLFAGSA